MKSPGYKLASDEVKTATPSTKMDADWVVFEYNKFNFFFICLTNLPPRIVSK